MAVFRAVVDPADTAPHGFFLPSFAPYAPAVEGAALAAYQPPGEGILGAVAGEPGGGLLLTGRATGVAVGELSLDCVEGVPADDALVVVLGQIHGELAYIADMLAADAVIDEALLLENVAAVFFILEEASDRGDGPLRASADGGNASPLQILLDHTQALTGQKAVVDAAHNLRLLGDDPGLAVLTLLVSVQPLVLDGGLALPHGLAYAPFDILADGLALSLSNGPQQGDEQFTVRFQCVDVLLLEDDGDAQFLQSTHIVKAVHRVSGEAGDGFD